MSESSAPISRLSPQEKRALLTRLLQDKVQQTPSGLPLSSGQQALWLTYRLAPESWAYNVLFSARLRSEVDMPALHRAFQALLKRHPSLRTTYTARDGKPEQQVHEHLQEHFEAVDVATWNWEALYDRLCTEARRPFDLERGPLMRVYVFTRSAREHILLCTVHHIAIDFWSLGLLLEELRLLYAAEKAGEQAALPPLGAPYADYVQWQAGMLASAQAERHWAYWQQQLADAPPVLHLPTDRPRPPVQTYCGASHTFQLTAALTQQLKAHAQAEGVTLYMLLLAAFDVLLYRYSGQEDIVVGTFMAGRLRPEFRRTVGYFTNPVVIRARLAGNPPFKTFLRQVRHTVLAALKHQEFPFPLLVERLQPERDASRSPVFQVAFVLQQLPQQEELLQCFVPGITGEQIDFGGLVCEPLALPQQEGQFDLTLEMAEVGNALCGGLKYNPDLFEAATIARLAGHLRTLLESIVTTPEQQLAVLPLLTAAERQQILVAWNDTRTDYPADQCIHQLFEAQVERTPDAKAIVYGKQQLTYRELNQRANRLAHHLRTLGVGPDVLVGICVERSLDMGVGLLGILKAGGAYVPLDPGYPSERLAFMLEDAQVRVLLTQQRLLATLPQHTAHVICLDTPSASLPHECLENPVNVVTPEHLAYGIYTSGSTGTPKGVLGLHRGAVNRLAWMWQTYPFAAEEVCCQKTSLNFVDSVWELFGPLLQGIRSVIIPDAVVKDPPRLVHTLAAQQVTRLVLVPSLLRVILDTVGTLGQQLPRLRLWISSGEPLPVDLLRRFQQCLPHSVLLNLYGSSEVSADITWYDLRLMGDAAGSVPIGRPIANTQIYLLDTYLNPVPVGVPGELYAGGDGLARGYLNRGELTAERFIPNPFSDKPGTRLYKTGDLARYLPDGTIEFLGRTDHQIKLRGLRIELGEIEAVLRQHLAIREVVVTAREDMPGDTRLVAYLVPLQRPTPTPGALRRFLKAKLPEYMIPTAFVFLDALPLTSSGKVNRLALPAPGAICSPSERPAVAPQTPVQEQLRDIWGQLLGLACPGIHDNFFELGGHSLLAVQLMHRVRQTFGQDLPLTTLLQAPTIAGLAACMAAPAQGARSSLIALQASGSQPPLFCLHPAGGQVMVYQSLGACLGPDQPLYGIPSRALTNPAAEYDSLEAMAVDYAAAIRQQHPEGPYYLLGWSMGGILALTVARLLEQQGQHVAFVGLVDTYHTTSSKLHDPLLGPALAFGGSLASALAALEPARQEALRCALAALSPADRVQRLMAWGREHHLLTADLPLESLQRQVALAEKHLTLCTAHQVRPIQAPLSVWWARDGLPGSPTRTDWRRYTLGAVHTATVAGNHFSLLQSPHVRALAEQLHIQLQAARQAVYPQ
jgi:amino acid adenylation domain-containing protein